jgi:prepilin-type N-terminal cleavage/methylation domain-containing protein
VRYGREVDFMKHLFNVLGLVGRRHGLPRAMPTGRQAFTLVELLVVISIIGLLSTIATVSLSSARAKSRDTKRMADLRQISQAIELFSNTNGYLPRNGAGWGTYISNTTGGYGAAFQSDLAPYLAKTPLDPQKAGQVGDYFYLNADNVNKYVLCANMENATGKSYDYSAYNGGSIYNYCLMPNG